MTLREEMKAVEESGGIYIPPYKLNEMVKISCRIVKTLTGNTAAVSMSYSDMRTILKMVDESLSHGIQQKMEGKA